MAKYPDRPAERDYLETVRAERTAAQREVIAIHERLGRGDRVGRRIDKLLERTVSREPGKAPAGALPLREWGPGRLRPVVEQFFAAAPPRDADEAALHRFRIRGKELRYAMELLVVAVPSAFREHLDPVIEAIQDRLGEINDLASSRARLELAIKTATEAGRPEEAQRLERLKASEQRRLNRGVAEFHGWCSPRMLTDLRYGFAQLQVEPSAPRPDGRPGGSCHRAANS